ncbi:aminotransferase class I/II-fold pyridoxal phosphate-dependent enzyme [Lacihabitans sp. LS3-19]|uniref:aminotransferase class I/II-fold pyridoxal phosphate-dependent enzyme n=1 Tax=Lacihabitans sp. LS3-19 TaxID=2487335 RepID=UPI0020CB7100|nr:aminotransferase class I/II-fold pyridoxal phosphate-dependent enzyme [Lacihabitans sp. LS3-19]MCP9768185.1 aminotransferase class I/II-fold pyridoxal phosphate-dependent enzyme [Lacihabitans sp. LS3-19]
MKKIFKELNQINTTFEYGRSLGIVRAVAKNESYDGKLLNLGGKETVFFGNCSYMGLDQHPEIKEAAKEAIDTFGMYFSSSRTFVGLELFEQMEAKLEEMFEKPVNVTTSTTFAHISNLPILIGRKDAIILDNYVHSSMQTAVNLMRNLGDHVELLRHNRLDLLEERIKYLSAKYENIWYMIDGIYSMMGDGAPMKELEYLMNKYEQFYVYADDAHGTSWTGKNGVGYVLNEIPMHPKLYIGMSMSKGFGTGGGLMVYPDRESKELVKNLGKTMIFSGPPHPAAAAAAIKSAEIHMRPEFADLQLELKQKIEYFWKKANQLNLPLSGNFKTPIFFIGTGTTENTAFTTKSLLDEGFFVSACTFPSVPINKTGIRITLSKYITLKDIDNLLEMVNQIFNQLENIGKLDRENIKKRFVDKTIQELHLV